MAVDEAWDYDAVLEVVNFSLGFDGKDPFSGVAITNVGNPVSAYHESRRDWFAYVLGIDPGVDKCERTSITVGMRGKCIPRNKERDDPNSHYVFS
jgi:hypothetical protein